MVEYKSDTLRGSKKVTFKKIAIIAVLTIIIIGGLVGTVGLDIYRNTIGVKEFKEAVKNNFAVDLLEVNGTDIATYENGRLAGPMLGAEGNDNRLYDIYARKNEDGRLQIYIKNEKGCYLEITSMAVDYIRKH